MQQAASLLSIQAERTHPRRQILAAAFFLVFLGAGLVFAAGFAGSAILHDTAHDVRHASGFPCH